MTAVSAHVRRQLLRAAADAEWLDGLVDRAATPTERLVWERIRAALGIYAMAEGYTREPAGPVLRTIKGGK